MHSQWDCKLGRSLWKRVAFMYQRYEHHMTQTLHSHLYEMHACVFQELCNNVPDQVVSNRCTDSYKRELPSLAEKPELLHTFLGGVRKYRGTPHCRTLHGGLMMLRICSGTWVVPRGSAMLRICSGTWAL